MTLPQVGSYHAVTPGPDGPDPAWYAAGHAGLMDALAAAAKAPRDGVPRTVTSVAGRIVTHVCVITDGVAAWPPGSAVVPARKPPRKSRKERS